MTEKQFPVSDVAARLGASVHNLYAWITRGLPDWRFASEAAGNKGAKEVCRDRPLSTHSGLSRRTVIGQERSFRSSRKWPESNGRDQPISAITSVRVLAQALCGIHAFRSLLEPAPLWEQAPLLANKGAHPEMLRLLSACDPKPFSARGETRSPGKSYATHFSMRTP